MPSQFGQPGLRKRAQQRPLVIEGRATRVSETLPPLRDPLRAEFARYQAGEIEMDMPESPRTRREPEPDPEPSDEFGEDAEEDDSDTSFSVEPGPDPGAEQGFHPDWAPRIELGDGSGGKTSEVPWKFVHRGIVIRADELDWEKLEVLWHTVQGLHQSSMFFVGDVMVAAEGRFGEELAQLSIDYRPETIRNAYWVAKSIPIPRRRSLPFSYHQAVASLEPHEQDELLDLVEDKRKRNEPFHTNDLKDLIRDRKEARRSNSAGETRLRPDPGVIFPNGEADEQQGRGFDPRYPQDEDADQDIDQDDDLVDPDVDLDPGRVEMLRDLITEVRAAGEAVGTYRHDAFAIRDLANRVLDAVGARSGGFNLLMDVGLAEQLVPAEWYLRITAGRREGGRRIWEVRLSQNARICDAGGPWLPCVLVETALAARVSDAERG